MKNKFKSRPILLTAALAGVLLVGCGPKSPSNTAVIDRPAAESPAVEAPLEGSGSESSQPEIAETPDSADREVAVKPEEGAGLGGPGEGVESLAGKDAMLVPEKTDQPSVYWVESVNNQIAFNPEAIAVSRNSPTDALTTAIETLLDGDSATAIPEGTKLISLKMEGPDIYIDLSGEFTDGGGTTSMATRMGQIVYTTTAVQQDANIWLSVDGEQLEYIGGEGLYVDQPLTRERFAENFNL